MSELLATAPIAFVDMPPVIDGAPKLEHLWQCLGATAAFKVPESGLAWAQAVDYYSFHRRVVAMNALLVGEDPYSHTFVPYTVGLSYGDAGGYPGYMAPALSDRHSILIEAHAAVRQIRRPEEAGEMLASVLLMGQFFRNANKRTARNVYGLATRGYDGSPETRAAYERAVDNEEPGMQINFGSLIRNLVLPFTSRRTKEMVAELPAVLRPEQELYDVRRLKVSMADLKCVPRLSRVQTVELAAYLSERHFNLPLTVAIAQHRFEPVGQHQLQNGAISASRLLRSMGPNDFEQVRDAARTIKLDFMHAIIQGYAYRKGLLADIRDLTASAWPARSKAA